MLKKKETSEYEDYRADVSNARPRGQMRSFAMSYVAIPYIYFKLDYVLAGLEPFLCGFVQV